MFEVSLSQAIDGSTIGTDFVIDALDDGTEVIVTDAVLSVMDGPSDTASAVTGGTPSTVYVHVSSATLAA